MPSMHDELDRVLRERARLAQERKAAGLPPVPEPAQPLEKALPSDWDDEGATTPIVEVSTKPATEQPKKENRMFTLGTNITNDASRKTFNYVLSNPGCSRKDLIAAVVAQGVKDSTVSSLLSQMVRCNMVGGTAKSLHAKVPEYRPVKSYMQIKREKEMQAAAKAAAKEKAKTKQSEPTVSLEERKAQLRGGHSTWSAKGVLEGLSVLQARALYDELKTVFGG